MFYNVRCTIGHHDHHHDVRRETTSYELQHMTCKARFTAYDCSDDREYNYDCDLIALCDLQTAIYKYQVMASDSRFAVYEFRLTIANY